MANYTLQQIDDKVRQKMVIQSDSTTYDRATVRIPKINSVIKAVCRGKYKDVLTKQIYEAWDMIFLRKCVPYVKKLNTNLSSNVTVWATIVPVNDTSNYFTSWSIVVSNNIIYYTNKTSNSFTWCTNVLIDIKSWMIVEQLYSLPTDYHKPFLCISNAFNQQIDFKDFRDPEPWMQNYILVWDNTAQYVKLVWSPDVYWFWYYMSVPDMVNDEDVCIIPEDYPIEMIAIIVAWELLFEEWLESDATQKLMMWYSKLHIFNAEYAQTNKNYRQKIKFKKTKINFTNTWR